MPRHQRHPRVRAAAAAVAARPDSHQALRLRARPSSRPTCHGYRASCSFSCAWRLPPPCSAGCGLRRRCRRRSGRDPDAACAGRPPRRQTGPPCPPGTPGRTFFYVIRTRGEGERARAGREPRRGERRGEFFYRRVRLSNAVVLSLAFWWDSRVRVERQTSPPPFYYFSSVPLPQGNSKEQNSVPPPPLPLRVPVFSRAHLPEGRASNTLATTHLRNSGCFARAISPFLNLRCRIARRAGLSWSWSWSLPSSSTAAESITRRRWTNLFLFVCLVCGH